MAEKAFHCHVPNFPQKDLLQSNVADRQSGPIWITHVALGQAYNEGADTACALQAIAIATACSVVGLAGATRSQAGSGVMPGTISE